MTSSWKPPKSLVLILAVLYSPNAASEAFAPHSLSGQVTRVVGPLGRGSEHPHILTSVDKPEISDTDSNLVGPEISLRGGQTASAFWSKSLYREMMAEMFGTFLIVHIGTGAVMSAVYTESLVGLFQIASVWIIAVTLGICTTASISGAHLNPAVSVAFAAIRPKSFNWKKVIPYSAAQLVGAIFGSWVNLILYSSTIQAFESANNIVRASSSGIGSAKCFGEYFL